MKMYIVLTVAIWMASLTCVGETGVCFRIQADDVEVGKQAPFYFLKFNWRSNRETCGMNDELTQDDTSIDHFSARVWLTPPEVAKFRQWVNDFRALNLATNYPCRQLTGKAAVYQRYTQSVEVVVGQQTNKVEWSGNDIPRPLGDALQVLKRMCWQIVMDRNEALKKTF